MAHGERAEAAPLDCHPAVLVVHRRLISRGAKAGCRIAGEPLAERIANRRVHHDRVRGVWLQNGVQDPARGLRAGIADGEWRLRQDAHVAGHLLSIHRSAEVQHQRSGRAELPRRAGESVYPKRRVGGKLPRDHGAASLRELFRRPQISGAGQRELAIWDEAHDASQRVDGVTTGAVGIWVVVRDPALALGFQSYRAFAGALCAESEIGCGGKESEIYRRAVDQLEARLGCEKAHTTMAVRGCARNERRPLYAKGKRVRPREARTVHRLEGRVDGHGVASVRFEQRPRRDHHGDRIAPLDGAVDRRRDPHHLRGIHCLFQRAGNRLVERHEDACTAVGVAGRRGAQHTQRRTRREEVDHRAESEEGGASRGHFGGRRGAGSSADGGRRRFGNMNARSGAIKAAVVY